MTTGLLLAVLSITSLILAIACILLASERNHWKREYESLRNTLLSDEHYARVTANRRMTLDEFVDSQG